METRRLIRACAVLNQLVEYAGIRQQFQTTSYLNSGAFLFIFHILYPMWGEGRGAGARWPGG